MKAENRILVLVTIFFLLAVAFHAQAEPLNRAQVLQESMVERAQAIQSCHDGSPAEFVVEIVIDPAGHVTMIQISGLDPDQAQEMQECLRDRVLLAYPASDKITTIKVPVISM